MIDKNTRNCNLVKRVVNIVVFYSDNNGNNFVDFDICRNCCR